MRTSVLLAPVAIVMAAGVTTEVAYAQTGDLQVVDNNGFYGGITSGISEFDIDYVNTGTPEGNAQGGVYGVYVGYQRVVGPVVLGVELDYMEATAEDSQDDGSYLDRKQQRTSYSSARLLIGIPVANGRFMPFITGGVGQVGMAHNQRCPIPASVVAGHCKTQGPYDLTTETDVNANVWGGGFRYALTDNVRVGLTWLHYETDTDASRFSPTGAGIATPDFEFFSEDDVVRLELGWQF